MKSKGMRINGKIISFEDTLAQQKINKLETKVVENLTPTTITLAKAEANTVYKYGTLTALTITAIDNSVYGTTIIFTAGTSKPTINLPSTLETVNFVEFEADSKYVIAIENNIAVMGKIGE